MNSIEEARNRLNLELRSLVTIIDVIDGLKGEIINYEANTLTEEQFLIEQTKIVCEIKSRLLNVFKD